MNPETGNITLIGCGKMGSALLEGWINSDIEANYLIIEPDNAPDSFRNNQKITISRSIEAIGDLPEEPDVIVLAIKPQLMPSVCNRLKPHTGKNSLILSIAAGQTISNFEDYFGAKQPIVRAMPNIPASISKGISVAVANKHANNQQQALADTLLQCVGIVEWTDNEELLDAVTAISGSGPAYVFYLIELLTNSAQKAGLNAELAAKLARQTVIGSAAMAEANPNTEASTLRENVTSQKGTTEAALNILMNGNIQETFDAAIEAAKNRSRELSS